MISLTGGLVGGSVLLAQAQAQPNPLGSLPLLGLMVAVFYFLAIRPQQKRAREHRALMGSIKQGDRVIAGGGIIGTVRRVDETTIALQVADNVVLTVDRSTIGRKIEE